MRAGLKSVELERTSLQDIMLDVQAMFKEKLREKSLTLIIDTGKDAEFVNVQRSSFTNSVMNNFISNAIKFSPDGTEIIVESRVLNGKFNLKIKDNGIGIPNEIRDKLFILAEGKSRLGTKGKKGKKGTGFGMAIVGDYLKLFNASIEVQSTPSGVPEEDSGTEFNTYFDDVA